MWWKTTSRPHAKPAPQATAFDEAFLRRLERLSIEASRTLRGGMSGAHPSQRRLPAPTFSDHRAYAASDDLRYVDWNAYARQENLFVKLGETEQEVSIHVVLDRSASMNYGTADQHKLQYGKMLLAALGYIALANSDRLVATTVDSKIGALFGPAHSRTRAIELLRYADSIHPGARGALDQALEAYIRPAQGGMLIVVSDLWALGDLQRVLSMARPPRWQVVLLHLLHRDELEPPIVGSVELEDSETNERLSFNIDAKLIEAYRSKITNRCRTIEKTCQQRGAAYTRIVTDMPLEQAVLPYLRQRKVLQG